MVGFTSYAALDLVWDTLDATIVLGQDISSLPCGRSRRPTRPILRPASTHPMKPTI
jgi:hypothetical protein